MDKGLNLLADHVFYKNYSQIKENGELETWEESIDRIYKMHSLMLKKKGYVDPIYEEKLNEAKEAEKQRLFLSSQRARQFATTNFYTGILANSAKLYNCTSTLVDRVEVFSQIIFVILWSRSRI